MSDKPIRVLHVVTSMDVGGVETLLMNIYRNIDREKVQFDFLVHRAKEYIYNDEIRRLGGNIYWLCHISVANLFEYTRNLKHFFNEHKEYKVIHSHLNALSTLVLYYAKKAKIPVRIAHSHNIYLHGSPKYAMRITSRFLLRFQYTHAFACSKQAGQWLFGLNRDFKIIRNAPDLEKFAFNQVKRIKSKEALGLKGGLVVGHVGNFRPQKNHDFLIDVFSEIHKQNPDSHLLLVGTGTLEKKILEKAENMGLVPHVSFLGTRTDVNDLYQAMDIFLFPSIWEGFGMVIIEAQASGLPCVVSTAISEEAFATDSIIALSLDKPKDMWASTVLDMAKIPRRNLAPQLVQAGFDIHEITAELQDFYLAMYEGDRKGI